MADLFVYGVIEPAMAKDFVQKVNAASTSLNVYINSPGGDVYSGFAMYNALQRKRDILTTYIDGLAYSAASWLAISAPRDQRYMSPASQFGVHQAINGMGGNKEDLVKSVKRLEAIDKIQLEIYKAETGLTENRIKEIMSIDEPMSFSDAQEFGFQQYQPQKIAALFNMTNDMDLKNLANILTGKADATEDVKAQVQKETEEALKNAQSAKEQLQADLVTAQAFGEHKQTIELFATAVMDYINGQPTKGEIEAWVEAKAEEKVVAFIKLVRTEERIPKATDIDLEANAEVRDAARDRFREKIASLENNFKK